MVRENASRSGPHRNAPQPPLYARGSRRLARERATPPVVDDSDTTVVGDEFEFRNGRVEALVWGPTERFEYGNGDDVACGAEVN